MTNKSISYSDAGVNITKGNESVELIKPFVQSTFRPEVVADLGGFGGLFALDHQKYEEPILVSGTDGVGTKLKIAFMMGKHDTIGIDAVAMCVNDILVNGAEPLFFLDYLAVGELEPNQIAEIVSGIADGCRQAGCALIGGETAEMPGFYAKGEYDVAGFCVGIVDKKSLINGSSIAVGDVVIGLASTGVHSNGFSLVRKVLFDAAGFQYNTHLPELGDSIGNVLLTPTKIYVKAIMGLLAQKDITVRGMAHITGGGLLENIPRILPEGLDVVIDTTTWTKPAIFDVVEKHGRVEPREMYRTFNMGIGYVLVVPAADAEATLAYFQSQNEPAVMIGEVVAGNKDVQFKN